MRLVTFQNSVGASRIGAFVGGGQVVDLNSACSLYLKEHKNEQSFERMADALVPSNMRGLFEGGDTSLDGAREALEFALQQGNKARGRSEEHTSELQSHSDLVCRL